jgi:hypothetical protein
MRSDEVCSSWIVTSSIGGCTKRREGLLVSQFASGNEEVVLMGLSRSQLHARHSGSDVIGSLFSASMEGPGLVVFFHLLPATVSCKRTHCLYAQALGTRSFTLCSFFVAMDSAWRVFLLSIAPCRLPSILFVEVLELL